MAFPKHNNAKRPKPGVPLKDDQVIEALTKCKGNISRAADKLGCARSTLYRHINSKDSLKELHKDFRERFLDETECVFQNKVLSGSTSELLFALKTLARSRGYDFVERDYVAESSVRGALDFIFNHSKNPAES